MDQETAQRIAAALESIAESLERLSRPPIVVAEGKIDPGPPSPPVQAVAPFKSRGKP